MDNSNDVPYEDFEYSDVTSSCVLRFYRGDGHFEFEWPKREYATGQELVWLLEQAAKNVRKLIERKIGEADE